MNRIRARWLVFWSVFCNIAGFGIVIGAKYLIPKEYFIIPQIIFGTLFGISSGIGYTGSLVISQKEFIG